MSLEQPDSAALRRSIKTVVEVHDQITVPEVVAEVADRHGCHEAPVVDALDQMDRHGFVYLVDNGDDREVRLP